MTRDEMRAKLSGTNGIAVLYHRHVARYSSRLAQHRAGASGFNGPELEWLLSLWEQVKANGFRLEGLGGDALCEVNDAIEDTLPAPEEDDGEPVVGLYQGRAVNRTYNQEDGMKAETKKARATKPAPKQEKKCSVKGCDRMLVNGEKGAANDLCGMHYRRSRRTGETGTAEMQRDPSRTHPLRVWIEPELAERLRKISGGASSPFARDAIERAITRAEKRAAAE